MNESTIELLRCHEGESLANLKRVLDEAGIPYRLASTAPVFDIASIGSGHEAQVIVSVERGDFRRARAALESDALSTDLPADHHLRGFETFELEEILAKESEWSPFDVAHARRLLTERGIASQAVAKRKEAWLEEMRKGKPAPVWLLLLGWASALMGGVIGLAIGLSLCYMKENTPDGVFPTYNAGARENGAWMVVLAGIVLMVSISFRLGLFD